MKNPNIFTTGQVAKLCGCAPRTVTKWIDSGLLKGYRLPGSTDRRVTRDSLLAFCAENGMPAPQFEREAVPA